MGKSDVTRLDTRNLRRKLDMCEQTRPRPFCPDEELRKPPEDTQHLNNTVQDNATSELPPGVEVFANQVAGHMQNGKTCGMLKSDGKVLKPILKASNGQTEIDFYEELKKTKDEQLSSLKQFVPEYFDSTMLSLNGKEVKCIVLEDITRNFKEPCIMDVKIGRQTWDPLAPADKIAKEEKKYQDTKRDLGLCIPGFLVHKVSNGRVCHYGKDYGKRLTAESVKDAMRIFLNAESGAPCRELLLQLLVDLWRILHWARKQRRIRLFSSSLLLIYDARQLKHSLANKNGRVVNTGRTVNFPVQKSAHLYKPISLLTLNDDGAGRICTGFSGQFTKDGPILNCTNTAKLINLATAPFPRTTNSNHPWEKQLCKLKRVHSFQNNYDKDLQKLKNNYVYMLDDLVDEERSETWAAVKMIDFAHAFPAEHGDLDKNYLEGIESLVKLVESFLSESA